MVVRCWAFASACRSLLDYSEENDTPTLGLIAGEVTRFRMDRPDLKVPHMGWNEVCCSRRTLCLKV